jgi:hypothetical protein
LIVKRSLKSRTGILVDLIILDKVEVEVGGDPSTDGGRGSTALKVPVQTWNSSSPFSSFS